MTDREAFEEWWFAEEGRYFGSEISAARAAWQAALASERAKRNKWKAAVIEQLIVSCIYQNKHEDDPMGALNDLLEWEIQIALDPKVSSQAQALIDRGVAAERAKQAEPVTMPEGFADYFAKNYNGEVVFSDPRWHAERVWRAAMWHAAQPAVQAEPVAGKC